MPGRTIGRYRLLTPLGRGGMATVWKAEDTLLRRVVALKLLSGTLADSPEARHRFVREARAVSTLDHPAVVPVYDAGESDGDLYIAFACVDGDTISQRAARVPFEDDQVIAIGLAAADALAHAHDHGIVHRDMTGRNVMIDHVGRVFVLDFGLAWMAGGTHETSSSATLGTCGYLAPEVAAGGAAEERSDIYGLGVVLYEALTGRLPFAAETPAAMVYAILQTPAPPPGTWRPGIRRDLENVVMRMLQKDPDRRFATAAEVADALRGLVREDGSRPLDRVATVEAAHVAPDRDAGGTRYLAVLPFVDVDAETQGDRQQVAFARGLAGMLRAALAHHDGLRVVSFTPGGTSPDQDDESLARSLGANLLLRGQVRRSGMAVRVSYSIAQPFRRLQVGGDTLDATMLDLFELEDLLVDSVLRALNLERSPRIARAPGARDGAAHERLIQALGYMQHHEDEAHLDAALAILERLALTEADSALVHATLGRAFLLKYRLTSARVWESRAASASERALSLDPSSPEVALTLGDLAVATGEYARALEPYGRALASRPTLHDAWIGMARAHEGLGQFDEAQRCCERAIEMSPDYWAAHNELGFLYFRQGRYEDSLAPWLRVVALAPGNYRGHQNLGSSYFSLSRYDEALKWSRRSVELHPNAAALSNIGTIHFYKGQFLEAAGMFKRALALRNADPLLWGNYGSACRWVPELRAAARGALEHAVALIRERLGRNPHKARDWARLACWDANLGLHDDARAALLHSLSLAPHDVSVLAQAVAIHEQAGDRPNALAYLRTALQHGYSIDLARRDPDLATLREAPEFHDVAREFENSRQPIPSPDRQMTRTEEDRRGAQAR